MTDRAVEVRDGKIFWRGYYTPVDEAVRMRDHFDKADDWFADQSHAFADQLQEALEAIHVQA